MKFIIGFLAFCFVACNGNTRNNKPSTIEVHTDTTAPIIKSGYYQIVDSTVLPSVKKVVYGFKKGDYKSGQECYLRTDRILSFDRIESLHINDNERPELYIKFDQVGTMYLAELTKSKVFGQASENDLTEVAMVIDNTLVQVFMVAGPIENGIMALSGPYSFNDLEKIKGMLLNSSK